MLKKTHLAFLLLSVFVVAAASGAPMLRLNIPRATVAMPDALLGSTGEHLEILSNVVDGEVRRRSPEPSNRP